MSLQIGKRIAHPDWVQVAEKRIHGAVGLLAQNRLPGAIEVFMIVTPVKHLLRGVYGSDLRAASVLFIQAIREQPGKILRRLIEFWRYKILCRSPDKDFNEFMEQEQVEQGDVT